MQYSFTRLDHYYIILYYIGMNKEIHMIYVQVIVSSKTIQTSQ